MRKKYHWIAVLVLLWPCLAVSDTTITYQGQLQGLSGPFSGQVDLQFELFDAETGGSSIAAPINISGVDVVDGLFQSELDFGNVYGSQPLWLAIRVDDDVDLPRQRLTAAPMAIHSESAATGPFWGLSGNAGTDPAENFIGTTDALAFEIRVSGNRAFRIEPVADADDAPNLIGGQIGNRVDINVVGATISGGGREVDGPLSQTHLVSGDFGTVSGGFSNRSGQIGVVSGGGLNAAEGLGSAVGGGQANLASGESATVPGGSQNEAGGNTSLAAGNQAKALHDGAFVWADSTSADFNSGLADEFAVRAGGGVRFVVGSTTCTLEDGDPDWSCDNSSDRNAKAGLEAVSGGLILQKVTDLPLYTWRYSNSDADDRHLGPMAQDFFAAFGLGNDDTRIRALDVAGVALAAIQELQTENAELKARVNAQSNERDRVTELENRLAALEAMLLEDLSVTRRSD